MSKNTKRVWYEDDQVVVLIDEETYRGTIVEVGKRACRVLFDDGDDMSIKTHRLMPYASDDSYADEEDDTKDRSVESNVGFNQFNVHWDKKLINFKFKADGGQFYGWWRKAGVKGKPAYCIDIHVEYKGHTYNVDSIRYPLDDPREDRYSLDSDICAACNKWFFYKCNGNFETIESLRLKANQPTVKFRTIEAFDMLILELKQFRDNAIRCGGRRTMMLNPSEADERPKDGVRVEVDFTTQARGLGAKGRVPALYSGAMLDHVTTKEGRKKYATKKNKGGSSAVVASSGSIDQLVKRLEESSDKTEKRKLRAALRKMGHKGGSRSKKS